MKKLMLFILLILGSITLAMAIRQDHGYVLVAYHGIALEFSLWTGIALIITSYILFFSLSKILRLIINLPARTRHFFQKRKQDKIYSKTSLGLLRLAEGNFKQAFNLLWHSAKDQKRPLINYLTAAKAAQELDDVQKRDECLRLAFECSPKSGLSIGIMQANLQCLNHEYEAALATLNHLQQQYGTNKLVLKQLLEVYIRLKDWYKLIKLLPELRRYKILSDQEILAHEINAATNYLQYLEYLGSDKFHKPEAGTQELSPSLDTRIETFYNQELSKKAKLSFRVVQAYINGLHFWFQQDHKKDHNNHYLNLADKNLTIIEKALASDPSMLAQKELIELYEKVVLTRDQFKKLEKQLVVYSYNVNFLFVLGKLALKMELFDKAHQYLNQASKLNVAANSDLPINYYLALSLLKLGREQESLELFSGSLYL